MTVLGLSKGQTSQLQHAVLPQVHRAGTQLPPSQPPQPHAALPARCHPARHRHDVTRGPQPREQQAPPPSGPTGHQGLLLAAQGQHHHLLSSKEATSNAWMSTPVCAFARRTASPPRPTWAVPQASTTCKRPRLSARSPPPPCSASPKPQLSFPTQDCSVARIVSVPLGFSTRAGHNYGNRENPELQAETDLC